jgi:hypothetical protein
VRLRVLELPVVLASLVVAEVEVDERSGDKGAPVGLRRSASGAGACCCCCCCCCGCGCGCDGVTAGGEDTDVAVDRVREGAMLSRSS